MQWSAKTKHPGYAHRSELMSVSSSLTGFTMESGQNRFVPGSSSSSMPSTVRKYSRRSAGSKTPFFSSKAQMVVGSTPGRILSPASRHNAVSCCQRVDIENLASERPSSAAAGAPGPLHEPHAAQNRNAAPVKLTDLICGSRRCSAGDEQAEAYRSLGVPAPSPGTVQRNTRPHEVTAALPTRNLRPRSDPAPNVCDSHGNASRLHSTATLRHAPR
jgi:hypothetical protein